MLDWVAMIAALSILVWALCSDGDTVGKLWLSLFVCLGITWFVTAG